MNYPLFGIKAAILLIAVWHAGSLGMAQQETAAWPTTRSTIPLDGRVNALIVFVQNKDDFFRHCVDVEGVPLDTKPPEVSYAEHCGVTPGQDGPRYESWTDDPVTEWPAFTLVDGDTVRALPQFAARIIDPPGTAPDDYTEGSLSHYYWLMSNGQFQLEGLVYPELFIPSCLPSECDGDPDTRTFSDWIAIAAEAIAYIDANPHGIDFAQFDRYDNRTGAYTPDADGDGEPDGDGVFDMLIVHYRSGPAFAPLGTNARYDSLSLGDKRISRMSGVHSNGSNVQGAVAVITHEIGHRQGLRHAVEAEGAGPGTDRMSVMWRHDWAVMSAPDRLRLGWVTPRRIDLATFDRQRERLGDTYQTNEVLHVTRGAPGEGDLIAEVRTWTNWWDRPSDGVNADGDRADFILPQEGLYLYKRNRTGSRASSMERTGLPTRGAKWRPTPPFAYTPGEVYTPTSPFGFRFYEREEIDRGLAITAIAREGNTFTFDVWSDFPSEE